MTYFVCTCIHITNIAFQRSAQAFGVLINEELDRYTYHEDNGLPSSLPIIFSIERVTDLGSKSESSSCAMLGWYSADFITGGGGLCMVMCKRTQKYRPTSVQLGETKTSA